MARQRQATENGRYSGANPAEDELKTNTLRTLSEPFWRYLNNNLGSANVINVKISSVCLEQKWA